MTYGENAGLIRDELAALLAHHRIQQRLGGPGSFRVPTSRSLTERAEMGRTMGEYRYAVLTWCTLALDAVSPKTSLDSTPARRRSPVDELRYQLDRTRDAYRQAHRHDHESGPRLLDLLATTHDFEPVVRWQRIASAAALGEHDFTSDVNRGGLSQAQRRTVEADAAAVVRGLVILNLRYRRVPGWPTLEGAGRLNHAAERVSASTTQETLDLSVDSQGWHPRAAIIDTPARPGVAGALDAQHNLLVELAHPPNALNLRRVIHAQAQVSHLAGQRASSTAPELEPRFTEREHVYRTLLAQSRNVGGLVGGGGRAVAESQWAITRLQNAPHVAQGFDHAVDQGESADLHRLLRLFTQTDARLCTTIERGLHERIYFVAVGPSALTEQPVRGVFQPKVRWAPVNADLDGQVQPDLLPTIRNQLRPIPPPPPPIAPAAQASRQTFATRLREQAVTRAPRR